MSATSEGEHMKIVGEAGSKFVVDVSGGSHSSEEEDRRTGAAPIEIMEAEAVDVDKVAFWIRRVHFHPFSLPGLLAKFLLHLHTRPACQRICTTREHPA